MAPKKTGSVSTAKRPGPKYKDSPAPVGTVEDPHHPIHTYQGTPQSHQLDPRASNGVQQNHRPPFLDQGSAQASSAYASPHLSNGHPSQNQAPYGSVSQEAYYASHPSPHSSTGASGHYPATSEAPELMATAHMQQRPYQPIYHTPQSNSPASVASPQAHDQHGRSMYGQPPPPLSTPMYGYPQYQQMNQSPYAHPGQQQHPGMTSQPAMRMHPSGPTQMSHPQVGGHPSGMTNSPRMKMEPPQQQASQQQPARMPMSQEQKIPTLPSGTASSNMHNNGRMDQQPPGGVNPNSAPGPIPATTPLVVRQDGNGVQWIAFEYSRDRVKLEYTIRCDVESVNVEELTQEFKTENCVYPRACCPKDQYRGNRLNYETECNAVGWALAELNHCLRGKRGLIQRAVDSWRNSNQDPRLRSRRVRRQAKINTRKGPIHTGTMGGSTMPGSAGIAPSNGGMKAQGSMTPSSMSLGTPQLHHHHAHPDGSGQSQEDVSGAADYQNHRQGHNTQQNSLPTDLRHSQIFHGYPAYPTTATGEPSMAPPIHHGMDSMGRPVGTAAVVSAEKDEQDEQNEQDSAMFGNLPEGKRRKFILVEDKERDVRVRVKVTLDQVNMKEIPDSYRQKNSVFPRAYAATQMEQAPDEAANRRFFEDDETPDDGQPIIGRTLVPVPMPDGTEGNVFVPRISRTKHQKEEVLNDLGYRMAWFQSRVFADRNLFLQRSLDAYRNKMRSTMINAGQEGSVSPHFETRPGKKRFEDSRKRTAADSPPPS